ncbi:MAG: hypothetical protein H9882_07600 [Candidatus Fournierella pullistercoris]|uniref:Uncharacterized protein n=1 Tax=Candidatus Allofournierella pullistercoris TaxID=2838597 RepID=A0A948T3K8_9FIRM|nr:hypothetical protein [Candidatus Fournierella pullistercoris]
MKEWNAWQQFVQTGGVAEYLQYKQEQSVQGAVPVNQATPAGKEKNATCNTRPGAS